MSDNCKASKDSGAYVVIIKEKYEAMSAVVEAAQDLYRYTDTNDPQPPTLIQTARFVLKNALDALERSRK